MRNCEVLATAFFRALLVESLPELTVEGRVYVGNRQVWNIRVSKDDIPVIVRGPRSAGIFVAV
jgi:hypothetical protein